MQKPKPIWEQKVTQIRDEVETDADSLLNKAKSAGAAAWILGGALAAAVVLILLLVKIL